MLAAKLQLAKTRVGHEKIALHRRTHVSNAGDELFCEGQKRHKGQLVPYADKPATHSTRTNSAAWCRESKIRLRLEAQTTGRICSNEKSRRISSRRTDSPISLMILMSSHGPMSPKLAFTGRLTAGGYPSQTRKSGVPGCQNTMANRLFKRGFSYETLNRWPALRLDYIGIGGSGTKPLPQSSPAKRSFTCGLSRDDVSRWSGSPSEALSAGGSRVRDRLSSGLGDVRTSYPGGRFYDDCLESR